jgi:hypothetical protein
MSTAVPVLIPEPFATSGLKNTIPDTSADPQRAEWAEGFPVLTMTPIVEGGKPPLGPDVNGVLYALSTHLYALQGGALQAYDSDVSDAIGGYNKGAIVAMADGLGYWICIVDDATDDPDAGVSANWRPIYAYGPAAISGLTGGVRTLTAIEASRPFLVLTGTLTSNSQIVVPTEYQQWLVINSTTGAFTLTVKTASGTGIVVPQGGAAAPVGVYCDGTNVQRQFTPSALPTSVAPVADTIALRDNLAFLFTTTPAENDSTTKVASTAFVNPARLLAANGYQKFASGLIIQWGFNARVGSSAQTVTYPIAFPTAVYSVVPTGVRRTSGAALGQIPTVNGTPGLSSFALAHSDGSTGANWIAIGI